MLHLVCLFGDYSAVNSAQQCNRLLALGLFLRPKRRLDCARSLVLQVGQDPGPVQDAPFSPRQLPLRFLELAFGMAHTLALDWIELPINGHTGF